jgi:predicted amidohydrolase YtcJ
LQRVAQKVESTPVGEWVRGHGWNQNDWPEGFGSAALLDEVAPNHPVYLTAKSLHASWANSAALKLAGVDPLTPDPANGMIQRDVDGNPTGILFENAVELVERVIPSPRQEEITAAIMLAQFSLLKVGVTCVHDFDGHECFRALQNLEASGKLKLRVVKGIPLQDLGNAASLGLQSGFGSEYVRIGPVKLFADGALGPQTAAMLEPYENQPGNSGLLFLNADQIFEYGQRTARSGLSLAIHAIGDRANREVLKAYARLRDFESGEGLPHLPHRIEHVQVLHPDDLPLLARLGITASMQPIHATSDMDTADIYWGKRARYAYAFRSLRELGTRLIFGSDAPVESPNPFWGLHAAVTRQRHSGYPSPEGWYPQEKLTLQQALESYTIHPAHVAGWGNRIGRLAPGYHADLIVLPRDPFQIDPDELESLEPTRVMVGGEWVTGE